MKSSPDESFEKEFNPNKSELFRNLFPNHSKSFRTNPKNFYLVWWKSVKNQSDLILFNPNRILHLSQSKLELILTEFPFRVNPNESEVGNIIISVKLNTRRSMTSSYDVSFRKEFNPMELELFWNLFPEPFGIIPKQSKKLF